jgi:hypothetical protein
MNIFALSLDPTIAAQWHCDKHVVKMLLESTQLLWTAQHCLRDEGDPLPADAPRTKDGRVGYRQTHKNHPCAIWTRATLGNYQWLCRLAFALAAEYHYRYPQRDGPHACEEHVAWLAANPPAALVAVNEQMTWPALAMPDEYKVKPANPMACYRAFYVGSKGARGLLVYTRREVPSWVLSRPGVRGWS